MIFIYLGEYQSLHFSKFEGEELSPPSLNKQDLILVQSVVVINFLFLDIDIFLFVSFFDFSFDVGEEVIFGTVHLTVK
jgi:hypothetical protein